MISRANARKFGNQDDCAPFVKYVAFFGANFPALGSGQKLGLSECRAVPAGDANGGVWWELLGADALVIVFGRAPGEEQPGGTSAAAKIARLATLADRHAAGLPLTDTDLTKPAG